MEIKTNMKTKGDRTPPHYMFISGLNLSIGDVPDHGCRGNLRRVQGGGSAALLLQSDTGASEDPALPSGEVSPLFCLLHHGHVTSQRTGV